MKFHRMQLPESGKTARHLLAGAIVFTSIAYPAGFCLACYLRHHALPHWQFAFFSLIIFGFCYACAESIRELRIVRLNGPEWEWEKNPIRFTLKIASILTFMSCSYAFISIVTWRMLFSAN